MLLALVVWLGGLIFFAFVVAPTAFSPGLLPSRDLAGAVIGRSLGALHWMGLISGAVFLISSTLYIRLSRGNANPMAARNLLIFLMLLLTAISQFAITPRMHAIRLEAGPIDSLSSDNASRAEFDRLHLWSERFEEGVFLFGLLALYTTARELH